MKALLRRWIVLTMLVVVLFTVFAPPAGSESFSEYQVKAVFLYNLINFIEWPETAFNAADQGFTIGILGPDPFGSELARAVANERIRGRAINIVHYTNMPDLDRRPCQMLFVNIDKKKSWQALREILAGAPVLTVADHAAFARQGGMINLLSAGNRIQLEINIDNARHAGLKISAKLLNLANLIRSPQ